MQAGPPDGYPVDPDDSLTHQRDEDIVSQKSIPIPQLGAALALVQLLQEHPELPVASWSVGEFALHGHLHEGGFGALGRYAGVLGGSIRPGRNDYPVGGRMVRSHHLHATWRDIPVEVVVVLPVAAETAVAA